MHLVVQPAAAQSQITIDNLRWEPTRVVNDKVYDGNVLFELNGNVASVSSITVEWVPVKYSDLPDDAFPTESEQTFDLSPAGGKSNGPAEQFSCAIQNITGGREYDVNITVKDSSGGIFEKTIRTPYIRQFENTAENNDLLIGAYYYPWYDSDGTHWSQGYTGSPLLGEYSSRDPIVISKQIDWATGHGIGFFMFSWWGQDSWEDVTLKDYFLNNPLADQIKFAILYESAGLLKSSGSGTTNYDLSDSDNKNKLAADFSYLNKQYFSNGDMLKLDGKPVVELYLARTFTGDVAGTMKTLHDSNNVYLIGDMVYWNTPYNNINCYDGITSYSMYTPDQSILDSFDTSLDQAYAGAYQAANNANVEFIPMVMPGFDDSAVKGRNDIPFQRSLDGFKQQIEIAKKYLGDHKMYMITSFNEWHEYTSIEPSKEYGFSYLDAIG